MIKQARISLLVVNTHETHKILIIEDHPILIYGLQSLLDAEESLDVCGVVSSLEQALDLLHSFQPALIIIDISLQQESGLVMIQQIKEAHPQIPLLCLSMHDDLFYAEQCLKAGACGYITKTEPCEAIILGIQKALHGEIYLSEPIRRQMLKQMGNNTSPWGGSIDSILSNKEIQVFKCIGQGLNNRQIAQKLSLSVKTIEAHRYRIKKKLNLQNSSELIRFAIRTTHKDATSI